MGCFERYTVFDVALPLSIVLVVGTFAASNSWLYDIGELSDKYFTTVTPAGYAFSIWGLIWFTQSAAIVWLLIRPDDETAEIRKSISTAITPWWALGAVCEVVWLVFYGRETRRDFAISALALIYGAFCFIQALFMVNGTVPTRFSLSEKALAAAGSALNGAWLSVASCIGILTILPAPNEQIELGAVLLALCASVGVLVSVKTSSVVYPLVLVWALVAVVVEEDRDRIMRVFAIIGICVSAVAAVLAAVRKLFAPKASTSGGATQYMTTSSV